MPLKKYIKHKSFAGTTGILCGGSRGIGRAIARDLVRCGGNLLVLARNKTDLEKLGTELEKLRTAPDQVIVTRPCDAASRGEVEAVISAHIKKYGVPDYLINNVGYAYPQYIEKLTLEDFRQNMDINYYGQLIPTLALLPHFMKAKKGHFINVSSMMGYFGVMGYASYCPTKFAIVGLSEVLRHELKPYNINVSVLYPPDTDTPGYAKENETKPPECKAMSESVKMLSAEQVSAALIKGIVKKKYRILPGEAGFVNRMYRHFPRLVRMIIDGDYKKARRKLGKK
jgi:3-dehydrosphinganine reductase